MDEREELRSLFPSFSDEELTLANENLERYLLLAWEIWEDGEMQARATKKSADDGPLIIYRADRLI